MEIRRSQLSFIKDLCIGETLYFNVILPEKKAIERFSSNKEVQKRCGQLLNLGMSLGRLAAVDDPVKFSVALITLFEEFEYSTSDLARQKLAQLFKKSKNTTSDSTTDLADFSFLETGRFQYFGTELKVPFEIDFFETFYSLCSVFEVIYERLVSLSVDNAVTFQYSAKVKKVLTSALKDVEKVFMDIDAEFDDIYDGMNK